MQLCCLRQVCKWSGASAIRMQKTGRFLELCTYGCSLYSFSDKACRMNLDSQRDSSTLFIYSLSKQCLIKQVSLTGLAVTFKVNANFLVIVCAGRRSPSCADLTCSRVSQILQLCRFILQPHSKKYTPSIRQLSFHLLIRLFHIRTLHLNYLRPADHQTKLKETMMLYF